MHWKKDWRVTQTSPSGNLWRGSTEAFSLYICFAFSSLSSKLLLSFFFIDYLVFLLVAQMVKNLPAFRWPVFDPWVRKIPWRREWQSTPVFLPGKFHGQRSLVGSMESHGVAKSWRRLSDWHFLFLPALHLESHQVVLLCPGDPKCELWHDWEPTPGKAVDMTFHLELTVVLMSRSPPCLSTNA